MELIETSAEEIAAIRQCHGLTSDDVRNLVKAIREWIDDNNYIFQEDNAIENQLVHNKYNVEKTKRKIKGFHLALIKHVEMFRALGKTKPSTATGLALPLPKLTAQFERILLLKMLTADIDFEECANVLLAMAVVLHKRNYSMYGRVLLDFEGFRWHHFKKLSPALLFRLYNIVDAGISVRVSALDLVNVPPFINSILALARLVLKPKLMRRLRVHATLEALHRHIPRACLPTDYGGDLEAVAHFAGRCDVLLEADRGCFDEIRAYCDRNGDHRRSLDVDSFRNLNID